MAQATSDHRHHRFLRLLFFVSLFLLPINAQRYGSHGYGSGTYGTSDWGSGYGNPRSQPSYGYGGQQSKYGTNGQQNGGEGGQFDRQNGWTERGGQNQQQENNHQQQQQQEDGEGTVEQNAPSAPQSHSNGANLRVDLPPGAPGTAEASESVDQSSK